MLSSSANQVVSHWNHQATQSLAEISESNNNSQVVDEQQEGDPMEDDIDGTEDNMEDQDELMM